MKKNKIFYTLIPVLALSGLCVLSSCKTKKPAIKPPVEHGKNDNTPDNILISVPVWRDMWVNEKHFNLLIDAQVDMVVAVTGLQNETFDTSRHMLEIAKATKREDGSMVKIIVHSNKLTTAEFCKYSEEDIQKFIAEFKGNEAVAGYHIIDEPYDVQPYTRVEKIIKNYDPSKITDINFLPGGVYGNYKNFYGVIDDYLKVMGDDASFLSFDNYPFPSGKGAVDESQLFGNFEAIRKAGLVNDIPTAFYLQAVGGFNNSYRKPDEGTLRYHTSSALSYGFKWIKYWSWFVPDYGNPEETYADYTDAIIGKDGEPTEMYEVVKKMHNEIKNIGTVLAKSDASLVYHSGKKSDNSIYEQLPSDFFIQPDGDAYAIISLFTHRLTGDQYLMIVNKNMVKEQEMNFNLSNINGLRELDKSQSGAVLKNAIAENGKLNVKLAAGDFVFYKIEGNITINKNEPKDGDNLLMFADVQASAAQSSEGWYINAALDGETSSVASSNGWKMTSEDTQWLTFDFGKTYTFNRFNIYPAGTAENCGSNFPTQFKIYTSVDGNIWTLLDEKSGIERPTTIVPSFSLKETSSRYVKIEISGNFAGFEVAELKLFNDGGQYTDEGTRYKEPVVIEGENIALGKMPFASGSAYESTTDRWGLAYINDGSKMETEFGGAATNGWMSNAVKKVTDQTYVGINLGNTYKINKVAVYPRKSGEYFPKDFDIQVSNDGENWTTVAEFRDEPEIAEGRIADFDTVEARYVRVLSHKLCGKYVDSFKGYIMQLSEIEIFAVK